jgi:hypothetical protein
MGNDALPMNLGRVFWTVAKSPRVVMGACLCYSGLMLGLAFKLLIPDDIRQSGWEKANK